MFETRPWDHRFPEPLVTGRLTRRYKRFLADIVLDDGREIVAHCMNTGRMLGLIEPGSRVWVSPESSPKRKLKWTWRIATEGDVLVGIDTQLPNQLVADAAAAGALEGLAGYPSIRREVAYGTRRSRIDILLEGHPDDPRPFWVEVKNATLVDPEGVARFPDAISARGLKHLHELRDRVRAGDRAAVVFTVQRADGQRFGAADAIDPAYASALHAVMAEGVEVFAFRAEVTPDAIGLRTELPFELKPMAGAAMTIPGL